MKYGNEVKVGVALVVSLVIFILGTRFFEDLPLFSGTTQFETAFENAGGIIAGNAVRINGLKVGSVESVRLDPETARIRVGFKVDEGIDLTAGTTSKVSGFDALGVVQMDLTLGPYGNPVLEEGAFIPPAEGGDLLGDLSERAPVLLGQIDTALVGLNATLAGVQGLTNDPNSDFRALLQESRGTAQALRTVLQAEQARLAATLDGFTALSAELGEAAGGTSDSLQQTLASANVLLARLDQSIAGLDVSTQRLDSILRKLDEGEGTLGLLINDPRLYTQMDSTLANVNALVLDVQNNPGRYLRELRLVDVF